MGRTATEKLWMAGAGAVAFLLLLIGYFFFISPQRSQTDDVNSKIADAQTQNLSLQARIAQLAAQNKGLAKYQRALLDAEAALPTSSGMSTFLRTLQSIGDTTATSLTSVSVGAPVAVTAPAPTSGAATPAPDAAAAAAAAAPSVYGIPITATVVGSEANLSRFLTQLQSVQPRAVLITSITRGQKTPDATTTVKTGGGRSTLNLTMDAFVAPPAPAATTAPAGTTP